MSKDTIRGALGILLLLVVASIGGALFYYPIPDGSRDAFIVILTFLIAKGGTVYDYYFGSSQSSSDQKAIISRQADTINIAAQTGASNLQK